MDKKGAKGGLVFLLVASAQSATAQLLSACEALVQLIPQLRRIDATASAIEECIKAGQVPSLAVL